LARRDSPGALLGRLWRATPLVRGSLAAAVALGVFNVLLTIAQAVVLANALGGLFRDARTPLRGDLVALVLLAVCRAIVALLSEPLTSRLARPVRHTLRARALDATLRPGHRDAPDAVVQLAPRGVDAIETYLATYVPALVLSVGAPVALLAWMAFTDPWSALIVTATIALLPVFMILLGLEAKERMERSWTKQQELANYFGDVVRGLATLKAHNRSVAVTSTLGDVGDELRLSTLQTLRVAFLSGFALELLSSLATALVALVLGIRLIDGRMRLTTALAVLLVTPEVYVPLRRAAARFHASSDAVGAAGAILDLLDAAPSVGDGEPAPATPPRLELRDVRVTVSGRDHHTLRSLSAELDPGAIVALEGPSGVGKSTLLRALAGLDPLDQGVILVDGTPLSDIDAESWHATCAWLPQDPLFAGATVREALTMGEAYDDARLRAALEELDLRLDLDRALGEGAEGLSAGQRRRLALARTLLRPATVLLLDEPTAHLDEANATLAMAAVRRRAVTTIIATHRRLEVDGAWQLAAPERFGV
jgi:ATP-binding cassette subfamily C protein CydCD